MKNTNPKVSIIVPVHNAGQRFQRCLDTLINQTLKEIEIILILDVPTDGSDFIAKESAQQDERIVIIENQSNLHIGLSRNAGIEIAKGKYIGFSDHDDFHELTMYEELYNHAQLNNSDLVLGVSTTVGEQNETAHFPDLNGTYLRKFAFIDLLNGGSDLTLNPLATNIHPNLYKTEIIQKNNIKFVDSRICTPEDRIFQIMYLYYSQSVSTYSKPLYFHDIHITSAGHQSEYLSYQTRANGKLAIYEFLVSKNIYQQYEFYFLNSVKKEFSNYLLNTLLNTKSLKDFSLAMSYLKKLPFTKKAFKTSHYSTKRYRLGGRISRLLISLIMNRYL
jgi:glycosyltransferase involved in cell wall biosynthesis